GLFDLFPPDRELPVRVELDGDRIASLRVFDPDTQRSREHLSEVTVAPLAPAEESEDARSALAQRLGRLPSEVERVVFVPAVSPMPSSWLDHAGDALLVVLEPQAVEEEIAVFAERLAADRNSDRDPFLPEELTHSPAAIGESLARGSLLFDRLGL